jgi:hypothetical protein
MELEALQTKRVKKGVAAMNRLPSNGANIKEKVWNNKIFISIFVELIGSIL